MFPKFVFASKTCLRRKSKFLPHNYTKTIPNFVLAAIQHYCFVFFEDFSQICFSRISTFLPLKFSEISPIFVLAAFQHLWSKLFTNLPKFDLPTIQFFCLAFRKTFWKTYFSSNSRFLSRSPLKTFPSLVLAAIQHFFSDFFLKSLQLLSQPQVNFFASYIFWDIPTISLSCNPTKMLWSFTQNFPELVLAAFQQFCSESNL